MNKPVNNNLKINISPIAEVPLKNISSKKDSANKVKVSEPRDTIKSTKRYKMDLTNYYHRKKMLTNYEQIYRLTFLKKNKYVCSGLYETKSPDRPDFAHFYLESRFFIKDTNSKILSKNLTDNAIFGNIVGKKINELLAAKKIAAKRIALDLGGHKKIIYKPFIDGVFEALNNKQLLCYNPSSS